MVPALVVVLALICLPSIISCRTLQQGTRSSLYTPTRYAYFICSSCAARFFADPSRHHLPDATGIGTLVGLGIFGGLVLIFLLYVIYITCCWCSCVASPAPAPAPDPAPAPEPGFPVVPPGILRPGILRWWFRVTCVSYKINRVVSNICWFRTYVRREDRWERFLWVFVVFAFICTFAVTTVSRSRDSSTGWGSSWWD